MKFFSFLLCVVLCLSFCVTSFAVELEGLKPIENLTPEIELEHPGEEVPASDLEQNAEVPQQEQPETAEPDPEPELEFNPDLGIDESELVGVSTFSMVSPITPEDTTGLKSVLLSVLGDYDPIVVEYEYRNNNNTGYSYLREVMPDYVWCASFLMLSLMVYCTFRIGGALIG